MLHKSCLIFRGSEQWNKVKGSTRSAWLSTLPGEPHTVHPLSVYSSPAVTVWLLLVRPMFHSEVTKFTHKGARTLTHSKHMLYPSCSLWTGGVSTQGLSYWPVLRPLTIYKSLQANCFHLFLLSFHSLHVVSWKKFWGRPYKSEQSLVIHCFFIWLQN